MPHTFLIGFMGAGKSTVGRLVALRLGLPFVDLDDVIERRAGRSIPDIFESGGEATFRKAESEALAALAELSPSVVACGGGVITSDENRAMLKRLGTVVYLEVSAAEALARIGETSGRPMLAGSADMAVTLLHSREALYETTADVRVETCGKTPEEVADEVTAALSQCAG